MLNSSSPNSGLFRCLLARHKGSAVRMIADPAVATSRGPLRTTKLHDVVNPTPDLFFDKSSAYSLNEAHNVYVLSAKKGSPALGVTPAWAGPTLPCVVGR